MTRPAATALAVMAAAALLLTPAVAAVAAPRDDPVIQTSADAKATEAPATTRTRVRDEMTDWRGKIKAFDERAEAGGKRQIDAAGAGLHSAWDKTEVEAGKLQAATARDWDRVKASYETASRDLADAWAKARP